MKSKGPMPHKYKNDTLVDKAPVTASIQKEIISITANVCEEKNACALCGRGGHYGLPLVFVLHYEDRSIDTVCYRCGAKAARKVGLKLPLTEEKLNEKMINRGIIS